MPTNPTDATRSLNVIKFFDWAYKNGSAMATSLEYIPLPEAVQTVVRAAWHSQVKGPDGKPVY